MRKVLIVEDNILNREILQEILSEEYQVIDAENGAQGLQILEEMSQDISLVLLDLQMPVMNGFEFLEKMPRHGDAPIVPVIVMTADDGANTEARCISLGAVEFLEKPYNPAVMLGRIGNIIRMREATTDIRYIETDESTGLYTRQAFIRYATKIIQDSPDKDRTFFAFEIQDFELVNSIYGEDLVKQTERIIADELKKYLQREFGLLGIYGGGRYVGMVDIRTELKEAEYDQLMFAFIKQLPIKNLKMKVGISTENVTDIFMAIEHAASAIDTVRDSFDKNVGIYNEELAIKRQKELEIENSFEFALKSGQFEPWLQPKINPHTGKIVGAEALIRWQTPSGIFNPPALYIPLFEKNGLVVQVDEFIFREVCKLQKKYMVEGKPLLPISVNMSRKTLYNGERAAIYRRIAMEEGVSPGLVPVEITESAALESKDITKLTRQMTEAGFSLHMDDFGSGYSSLTCLSTLPFEVIKIDKSLTDTLETKKGKLLIGKLIEVIQELGMKCLVEGVETAEQVDILKQFGCDAIQGYYYSKPLRIADYEQFVKRNLEEKEDL